MSDGKGVVEASGSCRSPKAGYTPKCKMVYMGLRAPIFVCGTCRGCCESITGPQRGFPWPAVSCASRTGFAIAGCTWHDHSNREHLNGVRRRAFKSWPRSLETETTWAWESKSDVPAAPIEPFWGYWLGQCARYLFQKALRRQQLAPAGCTDMLKQAMKLLAPMQNEQAKPVRHARNTVMCGAAWWGTVWSRAAQDLQCSDNRCRERQTLPFAPRPVVCRQPSRYAAQSSSWRWLMSVGNSDRWAIMSVRNDPWTLGCNLPCSFFLMAVSLCRNAQTRYTVVSFSCLTPWTQEICTSTGMQLDFCILSGWILDRMCCCLASLVWTVCSTQLRRTHIDQKAWSDTATGSKLAITRSESGSFTTLREYCSPRVGYAQDWPVCRSNMPECKCKI